MVYPGTLNAIEKARPARATKTSECRIAARPTRKWGRKVVAKRTLVCRLAPGVIALRGGALNTVVARLATFASQRLACINEPWNAASAFAKVADHLVCTVGLANLRYAHATAT